MTEEQKQALIDEIVIQALRDDARQWQQRAEAAEAKLAELAKQEPAAFTSEHYWSELNTFGAVKCVLLKNGNDPDFQVELFTRPTPAADLAELVPDEMTWNQAHSLLDINQCGEDRFSAFMMGANYNRSELLRKIQEAK